MNHFSEDELHTLARFAQTLSEPLRTAYSSFVLHAPLDFSARVLLLAHVSKDARAGAFARIGELVGEMERLDARISDPSVPFVTVAEATAALKRALSQHDADAADAAVRFIAQHASARAIRAALIDTVAPSLGAAAHAPILLADLEQIDRYVPNAAGLLRAPVRTLARATAPAIAWHIDTQPSTMHSPQTLFQSLANPPHVVAPSTSIAPTVAATIAAGLPDQMLRPALRQGNFPEHARTLLRVAAWSMLQDDPAQVPYGWTHCLTIPLGLLRNVDVSGNPTALLAIAATHSLAFRATLGRARLQQDYAVQPTAQRHSIIDEAAQHHDAHVAKYMHACLCAAEIDPDCTALYFAAAERLLQWWRKHDA